MAPSNDDDCPNALLLSWVKEWYDKAREQNSKGVTTYKKAYQSLQICPVPFDHPSQLKTLVGFGDGLCSRLTVKLQEHCNENNLVMPEHPTASKKRKKPSTAGKAGPDDDDEDADDGMSAPPAKKPKKTKAYVPTIGSGAYALVIALSKQSQGAVGMSKSDLIDAAQPYSKSSFSAPSDPNSFYTAWNSMKTLLSKELVYERGRPTKRYALTDEGWEVAKRIEQVTSGGTDSQGKEEDYKSDPAIIGALRASEPRQPTFSTRAGAISDDNNDDTAAIDQPDYTNIVTYGSSDASLPTFDPIILRPGTFEVRLVVDVREIRARSDRDFMREELHKLGVRTIVRAMGIGDFQWVAKCHDPDFLRRHGAEGDEIVLDYCVERKRLDDLISSIKEGRYAEQKFRLRRSGVKHVTYIVEEISLDTSRMDESIESAIASMQVVNGFTVKKTKSAAHSCQYLAGMTHMLKKIYEDKPLKVIPTDFITTQNYLPLLKHLRATAPGSDFYITYPAFASLVSKRGTHTLRDLFLRMLMCVRGVTGEKAIEIQKIWKTPNEFIKAFESCGPGQDGEKKKQHLVYSRLGSKIRSKQIGKAVSAKIAATWGA